MKDHKNDNLKVDKFETAIEQLNSNLSLKLRSQIKMLNESLINTVNEIEKKAIKPNDAVDLNDTEKLSELMQKTRKRTGTTMEDLELQTGISYSTLKRIFTDPSSARFSSVILVLNELGIKSWAEK
jgi:DNA-binding phage protein